MGLFGRKEEIPDGIRVQYYEGELKEFPVNHPCQVLLMDDALRITKVKPYIEVKLERKRILGIDIYLDESKYMEKYKGTNVVTSKNTSTKNYYVLNYLDKNGNQKHLDFWGTSGETRKMMKMSEEISRNKKSISYEI